MFRIITCVVALFAGVGYADTFMWTGAVSTSFNSNGNWTTNGVVADQEPPTAADVIFDSGSVNVTADLDQSAKNFTSLLIGRNYTGRIGNSTSDTLECGATKLVVNGGGTSTYIATGATYNFDDVVVKWCGPNGGDDLYIGGTIVDMSLNKGDVYVISGSVMNLWVDGAGGSSAVVDATITATVTNLYGLHGDVNVDSGTITLTYFDSGTLDVDGGTLTTLVMRGGTCSWGTTTTLGTLTAFGGTFDASADVNPKTISNVTSFTGATLNFDNGANNITLTAGVIAWGGTITSPAGATVSY